jgi:cytochrome c oxidase subunit 2
MRSRLLPGLFLLLLSACGGAEKYPQTALDPKSDFGVAIDDLQHLTIVLGSIVGVLVFLILVYSLVRFRYRPGDPTPNQVHGNTTLELAWTLIPALLLAAISVPTTRTIFFTYRDAPPGALEVDVRGYQWWWSFSYPLANGDTVVTANEIHVPVGQPVVLKLNSNDVIHSFWIPQMGGKRDVIPRRTNTLVFTPSEAGVYLGQCAEFCGDSHALMRMRLIAHEPAEYAAWLENESRPAVESTDSAVLVGKKLVTTGACIACHTIEGTDAKFGKTGPNLTHLARRSTIAAGLMENNAENLTKWITDPQAVKPGALMPAHLVPEQEIKYVVAYLQTLY